MQNVHDNRKEAIEERTNQSMFPPKHHKFDEWTKHVLQMFKNEP